MTVIVRSVVLRVSHTAPSPKDRKFHCHFNGVLYDTNVNIDCLQDGGPSLSNAFGKMYCTFPVAQDSLT